jgi:hypothetical protein
MATKIRPRDLLVSTIRGLVSLPLYIRNAQEFTRVGPLQDTQSCSVSPYPPKASFVSSFVFWLTLPPHSNSNRRLRNALRMECSFSKSALSLTAALRLRTLEWKNGAQGLLGHFRFAWADRGLYLAHHVGASRYHSYRHVQLVGGLSQRVVLTLFLHLATPRLHYYVASPFH